jgi:hypothetical protein
MDYHRKQFKLTKNNSKVEKDIKRGGKDEKKDYGG